MDYIEQVYAGEVREIMSAVSDWPQHGKPDHNEV